MSPILQVGCIPIAIKSKYTATDALIAPDMQLYLPQWPFVREIHNVWDNPDLKTVITD